MSCSILTAQELELFFVSAKKKELYDPLGRLQKIPHPNFPCIIYRGPLFFRNMFSLCLFPCNFKLSFTRGLNLRDKNAEL